MTCTCCWKHAVSCEISFFFSLFWNRRRQQGGIHEGNRLYILDFHQARICLKCDLRRGVVLRLGKWQIDTLPLFAGMESVCVRWMKYTTESWLSCHSWEEAAEFSCTDATTPARHVQVYMHSAITLLKWSSYLKDKTGGIFVIFYKSHEKTFCWSVSQCFPSSSVCLWLSAQVSQTRVTIFNCGEYLKQQNRVCEVDSEEKLQCVFAHGNEGTAARWCVF